jgi:hypothetical protein
MTHRFSKRSRFSAALAVAGAAVFATSGLTFADSESGQHGHYIFRDDAATGGATCVYSAAGKLTQIVVKAPALWWPDTDSGNNREHGKVGWQLAVQISLPGAYGPWNTLYTNSPETNTASEDQPAYDKADKARLSTWTLYINGAYKKKPNAYARVQHTAFWYNPDGSTMGEVEHDQFYYKMQNVPGNPVLTTACAIHYT